MSLLTRSINILTRSSPIISFSNIQCRYAGGGGRPGGKPSKYIFILKLLFLLLFIIYLYLLISIQLERKNAVKT